MSERAIRIRARDPAIRDPSRRGVSGDRVRNLDLELLRCNDHACDHDDYYVEVVLDFHVLELFVHSVSVVVSARLMLSTGG